MHRFHTAEFCEIIVGLNQNLSCHVVVVVSFEFWFVVSIQWMKC
jgi:hypothetical protein